MKTLPGIFCVVFISYSASFLLLLFIYFDNIRSVYGLS